MNNILLFADSYKFSHYKQYPPKTEHIYSYFESRNGAKFDNTVFFGLQYFLKKYLAGQVITQEKIDYAANRIDKHMGAGTFNRRGWEYILNKHQGKLPIAIKAVPEGSVIPTGNVLMTIVNTDKECYWLTNFVETLLVNVWYPCTVATQCLEMKKIIKLSLDKTGYDKADFKLHDFGMRGVSCPEQAALGGASHLISFNGTDNFHGIEMLAQYYDEDMAGFSIPASEHSTITSWGKSGELDAYRNMLRQYPTGLVACVSDSYNIWNACENYWGKELQEQILNRDGTLIIRPDSGTPYIVVNKLLDILGKAFGFAVNNKKYKVLNPHVRIIQGDKVDIETLQQILNYITSYGWSTDNVSFGSGGGILQNVNRDTQKFAFKCSAACIDGHSVNIYKDPITDINKVSKTGQLCLIQDEFNKIKTVSKQEYNQHYQDSEDLLKLVFYNGKIREFYDFNDVRNSVNSVLYNSEHSYSLV